MLEARLRGHELALIPYLMAGDPDLETTESMARALANNGAAALELGIPYGDPLADGPTIAAAGQRALARGTGTREVLALAKRLSDVVPIVLFTYFNPIYRYGLDAFAAAASSAGAAGIIVPDVTLEELESVQPVAERYRLAMPLLVAPTTPAERAERIARRASGFIYVVSRLGVTGASAAPNLDPVRRQVSELRSVTDKPLAVGFGISSREHVDAVASFADAAIVGSALIDAYGDATGNAATERVERFWRTLR